MDNSRDQSFPPTPRRSSRHTLTHLIVGGIAFGLDALSQRLDQWESLSDHEIPPTHPGEPPAGIESTTSLLVLPEPEERSAEIARYALVGLLFNAQDRLSLHRREAGLAKIVTPAILKPAIIVFTAAKSWIAVGPVNIRYRPG
jgi:hypothetical protein